jgi:hypothetical protein
MYRTKTVDKIISTIGKSLYDVAKEKGIPLTKFSPFREGYVLGSYNEERVNPADPTESVTVEVLIYADGYGIMYCADGCSYSHGSIPALISIMDDMQLHTPEAEALREYASSYNKMKKLAWGKEKNDIINAKGGER